MRHASEIPTPSSIAESTFAIAANGRADGPAQALRDYLLARGAAAVTVILHPLVPEDGASHEITRYEAGRLAQERSVRLPSRPPLTYPLDLVVPAWPKADIWFGFNSLACLPGLAGRALGRVDRVVYWCVDYVERRFGTGLLTRGYTTLDGLCCRHADARFELSAAALEARSNRHRGKDLAPAHVVPMGAWLDRVATTKDDQRGRRKVVFLGHLVPRQGADTLLRALALLREAGDGLSCEIVGRGPEEARLRELAGDLGLAADVTFHGFVDDHREVERILAGGSVAAAPYVDAPDSFTRYADPGKLKAYLAAGLPIVTTRVSPNAADLERRTAAVLVDDDPAALAEGLRQVLSSDQEWHARRAAALAAAREYDWNAILDEALARLGFPSAEPGLRSTA